MFNSKRKSVERLRHQQEQFATQIDKQIKSQEKAHTLMRETLAFAMLYATQKNPTQYEQAKSKLSTCLSVVQQDEILKHNEKVMKLVNNIYRAMDDKDALLEMVPDLAILTCAV